MIPNKTIQASNIQVEKQVSKFYFHLNTHNTHAYACVQL